MRAYYLAFIICIFSVKAVVAQSSVDSLITLQKPKDTPVVSSLRGIVDFTTLLNAMESATKWTIFKDIQVRFNHTVDKGIGGMDYIWNMKTKKFVFNAKHIGLYNVDFDPEYWLVLRDAVFNCQLSFVNCTGVKLVLEDCRFNAAVRMHANKFEFATFTKCKFFGGFRFTRGEVSDNIKFLKSDFSFADYNIGKGGGFDMDDRLFLFSNKIDGIDLIIDSCSFEPNKKIDIEKSIIDVSESKFKNLIITNSKCNTAINIENTIVDNLLTLENNENSTGILFKGVGLNSNNTFIDWSDFKDGKLLIFDRQKKKILNKDSTEYLFTDKELYNHLISSYTLIFNIYKAEGNRDNANACYIEWKDLETKYIKKNKNTFLYLINRFLKTFCDYGTSITKPLLFSFKLILFFSVLYFIIFLFYASTLDLLHTQAKFLLEFHNRIKNKEEYPTKAVISEHKKGREKLLVYARRKNYKVSPFVRAMIFSFNLSSYRNNFTRRIFYWLRRLKHSKFNKATHNIFFKLSIGTFKAIFLFLTFFAIFVEAFFLSINAFTTLGFGEFKVTGRLIYLTIIEGFIGWLLLSIFTVALINQMINW